MLISKVEQLGLEANFTPRERAYFDKLKAEFLELFEGSDYETIKADNDTAKLKKISRKLAQLEDFVKTRELPEQKIKVDPTLCKFESVVDLPATTKTRKVSDVFIRPVDHPNAPAQIGYMDRNFEAWFGEMTIEPHPQLNLALYTLQKDAYDREILTGFGNEEIVETDIGVVWDLIEKQKNCQPGTLQNNGKVTIFYVRDKFSELRVIAVGLAGGSWDVAAYDFDSVYWDAGFAPRVMVTLKS